MGYQPGEGLGKFNQRITQPIQPPTQQGQEGLGYQTKIQKPFLQGPLLQLWTPVALK